MSSSTALAASMFSLELKIDQRELHPDKGPVNRATSLAGLLTGDQVAGSDPPVLMVTRLTDVPDLAGTAVGATNPDHPDENGGDLQALASRRLDAGFSLGRRVYKRNIRWAVGNEPFRERSLGLASFYNFHH